MDNSLIKYDVTDAAIQQMKSEYMPLVITDVEDKDQFQAVHDARMVVKNHRVAVDKKRKELNADALAWQKKVNSEANKIFAELKPIENHLQAEEDKVTEYQKWIKAEQERLIEEKIQSRVDELMSFGVSVPYREVAQMDDDTYFFRAAQAKQDFEAEQKRLRAEQAEKEAEEARLAEIRKKEEERMAAEAAALEKARKEQEEREAAIRAEQEKIETERRELEATKQAEKNARFERRLKALEPYNANVPHVAIEAMEEDEFMDCLEKWKKAYAERQAAEKVEAERLEKERLARAEALQPDRDKLNSFGLFLEEGIRYPQCTTIEGQEAIRNLQSDIQILAQKAYKLAQEL